MYMYIYTYIYVYFKETLFTAVTQELLLITLSCFQKLKKKLFKRVH